LTDFDAITATSYGGITEANLFDKSADNVIATTLDASTGNEIAFDLGYTVNKATSGNDTGLRINVTDTASPGTSLFAEFVVGGVTKFSWSTNPTFTIFDDTGADSVAMSHDGTDFNMAFTNTTAINITGATDLEFPDAFAINSAAGDYWTIDEAGDPRIIIDHIDSRFTVGDGYRLRIRDSGNTDHADFYHDGTDFNIDFTNTRRLTFGSVTEDVTFNPGSGFDVRILGGGGLEIFDAGSTDKVNMSHDGTDFYMDFTNTAWLRFTNITSGVIFDDGAAVYIRDSTGADSIAMSHDGTDFNTSFTNTTDWNITGLTSIDIPDTTKLTFGSSQDLDMHWDGANGWFEITMNGGDIIVYEGATIVTQWNDSTNRLLVGGGWDFAVYDSGGTDYAAMSHDGTDFTFDFFQTGQVFFDLATVGYNFMEAGATKFWINHTANQVDIRDGYALVVRNSADTDYHTEYHDGTNYWSGEVNTTAHIQYTFAQSRISSSVLHTFNRLTTDGALVNFAQADTTEGSISVSGTTVSYNGAHLSFLSQLPSNVTPRRQAISRGTVMQYVNEKAEWFFEEWEEEAPEGQVNFKRKRPARSLNTPRRYPERDSSIIKRKNEQRMRSKVSDEAGTKAVAGVFERWDDDQTGDEGTWDDDFMVATTGDFIIRVTGPCEVGDLLESNGDGTARVQADDIIRSSTVAKAVQSFPGIAAGVENPELVPCQLLNG
jgi:hypothetical protein